MMLLVELIVELEDKESCDIVELGNEFKNCRRTRPWTGRIPPNAKSVDRTTLHGKAIGTAIAMKTWRKSQDRRLTHINSLK